ncbi:ATP-binding protein [Palleronia sp. LCG004]|uniref:ATP-binding protein n=1 Tax=Palleronia sp. LCG004 TaxID=3079304 RepID=UPI002942E243|nr:ATP-binding protein [Palleronia sp. LCG004]WOI58251.1 ATP-binding protein [Palleronia sp. LCG004]
MQNVMPMVENAAIILLATMLLSDVRHRFEDSFVLRSTILGVMFTIVGTVVMNNSIELVPGTRTDPRLAVVTLSAAFGGPLSAAITSGTLAFLRYSLGGAGMLPGTVSILAVGLVGAVLWVWWKVYLARKADRRYLLIQALAAGAVAALIVPFITPAPGSVVATSILLFTPANFGVVWIMGIFFLRDEQRRTTLAAHAEKEAQIRGIANNAPSVLCQIVRSKLDKPVFTYVSDASDRILGVSSHTILADPDAFFGGLTLAARSAFSDALGQSASNGEPAFIEMEYRLPNGERLWLAMAADLRLNGDNDFLWDGTITDITRQKAAEHARDEFISVVSHELRTPLTSIRGSLGLLINGLGGELPEKAGRMLSIADRNSERLVLLINDLLDMQKFQSGEMRLELDREALRPMLENALDTGRNYAPEKKVRFILLDEAPGAIVHVDANRFHQAIMNLVSNAMKFTPAESTVTLSATLRRGGVRISVADEGPGIPEEFRNRIFQQFQQANSSSTRGVGGTGLGLNIARAIAEGMAGAISFESEAGRGSTFYIDLPLAGVAAESGGATRRALICATDAAVAVPARRSLDVLGIASDVAPDGMSAGTLLRDRDYAAIVIDAAIALRDVEELSKLSDCLEGLPVIVVNEEISTDIRDIVGKLPGLLEWVERPLDFARLRSAMGFATNESADGRARVLYIEDDLSLQEIIAQSIGECATTTFAATVEEARWRLEADRYDLVILDQELPDGSGLDLIDEIPSETPIVLYSAFDLTPAATDRVRAAMTKSVASEAEVRKAVLSALDRASPEPASGERSHWVA